MAKFEISINLDKKCDRCGKGGAAPSGICLHCAAKMIGSGEMDRIKNKQTRKETE